MYYGFIALIYYIFKNTNVITVCAGFGGRAV